MAKVDALALQATADGVLYDTGFADGKASVVAGGISSDQEKADIQAAVDAAVKPLNDQITAMQLAKAQEDTLLASVQKAAKDLLALLG